MTQQKQQRFPPQQQAQQPGRQTQMQLQPESEAAYKAADKLQGQAALITSGDYMSDQVLPPNGGEIVSW